MIRIQEEIGVNICDAFADPESFTARVSPAQAITMVWIAIRDEARQRNVSEEDFLDSLANDALLALNKALWSAIILFSQPLKVQGTRKN